MDDKSPRTNYFNNYSQKTSIKSHLRKSSVESAMDLNINEIQNIDNSNLNEINQNFKFTIFYLILFFIIFISNLIYFNAPSHHLDNYIDDTSNHIKSNNLTQFSSHYKVVSRFTDKNRIFIELYKIVDNSKLFVNFIFSNNRINIKIFQDDKEDNFPYSLYDSQDFELEDKKINFIEESNFGVVIINYPFNFIVYRKDTQFNQTVFDTRNNNSDLLFLYSNESKQIYTKLPENHFSFGLGEEFSNLRLDNKRTYFLSGEKMNDDFIFKNKFNKNGISSLPILININPLTLDPNGIVFLNTGPIEVNMRENGVLFKFSTGIINFYIFNGNSPKEVIEEYQKTLGMPLLPSFESLEWQDYINDNEEDEGKLIMEKIRNSGLNKIHLDFTKNLTNLNEIINNTEFSNITFYNFFNSQNNFKNNRFDFNIITIKTNISNDFNNISPFLESKEYFNSLKKKNITRPLIFSFSTFLGSSQYSGKWLGYIDPSLEGMKQSLLHTMKYNLYGNPHTVHEACGNSEIIPEFIDLCLKWIQMISVFPHARINNFSNLKQKILLSNNHNNLINLKNSLKLRYSLSLYIYSYFLKMSLEGGSLIRPLIMDFVPKQFMKELMETETQFMVGSNLMINPIFELNKYKNTFFPSIKFYDFYSGEIINQKGPGFYNMTINTQLLPIYVRGGLITPLQNIPDEIIENTITNNFSLIKKYPIKLIIALDINFRSTGRILLDNTNNNEILTKKIYYKMEITASYINNNFILLFHVNSYKYKPPSDEYPLIDEIIIYGFSRISVKKVTVINKISKIDISRDKIRFDDTKDILSIIGLEINMDSDTKVVIT